MKAENAFSIRPMMVVMHHLLTKESGAGSMDDFFFDILKEKEEEEEEQPNPLFVVSNDSQCLGAAGAFCPGLLKNFTARKGMKGCYLIPSSIHEMLLVSEEEAGDPASLRTMIREVNREVLRGEDRLSDSLYYYDAAGDQISIAGTSQGMGINEIWIPCYMSS